MSLTGRGIPRRGSTRTLRPQLIFGLPVAPPPEIETPSVGVVTLSGNVAATRQRSTPSIGITTLSGLVSVRARWRVAVLNTATVTLSGLVPTTSGSAKVFPSPGVISLTGQAFGGIPVYMPVPFRSITLSGLTIAKVKLGQQPLTGILNLYGLAPTVRVVAKPPARSITLSGLAPLFKKGAVCLPGILYLFGLPPRSKSDWEAEDTLKVTVVAESCTTSSLALEACTTVSLGVEDKASVTPPAEAPVTIGFVPKDPVK